MPDPTARALRLLSLLQTHRSWSAAELTDRLGVSARTLRRDIDRLRDLGYRVDATPGRVGGYRLATGTRLPPLLLDDDEAVAIAVGLRAAAGAAVSGVEEASLRALAKLEQVLPDRLRRRVAALHGNVSVLRWSGPEPEVDAEVLVVLAQACRDREEARFDYVRRDGERARRLVQPHRLVSVGRRWYLVAWDVRRADWRTFRLDRMDDARLAGARFEPREVPGGDAAAFVARSLRESAVVHRVTAEVGAPAASLADVGRWFDSEVVALGPDRSRLDLRAESLEMLLSMVTTLATRAAVTLVDPPPELAALVTDTATRLAAATGSRNAVAT